MKSPTHSQTEQQPARSDGPMAQSEEMVAGADEFRDEPTVSNRCSPAAQPARGDSEKDPTRTPTGAYRLVRPATSDRLDRDEPPPPVTANNSKKRAIIGVTRRR